MISLKGLCDMDLEFKRLFLGMFVFMVVMSVLVFFFVEDWMNILSVVWGSLLGIILAVVFIVVVFKASEWIGSIFLKK